MELTTNQVMQQGIAAHQEGSLEEAERLYKTILKSQPLHPDANHNLGVLAVLVNEAEAALPLFKTALEANPKIEQFWLSYIDALIKTERFDDVRRALADAQQAEVTATKLQIFEAQLQSELPPGSHIPQQEFGNTLQSHQNELSPAIELFECGKYREAQNWLEKFIETHAFDPEALSFLSQVLLTNKQEIKAQQVLDKAATISPRLPSIFRNKARLLLKQAKASDALKEAQSAYEQSPDNPESSVILAACMMANRRDQDALPLIEKALKSRPDYAEAFAIRARIRERAGDVEGAIKDTELVLFFKPHLNFFLVFLGNLKHQVENLSGAIEALRKALEQEPNNLSYMITLGDFLLENKEFMGAQVTLANATKLAPENELAWINLGVAFQRDKKLDDAKVAYERALVINPRSAACLNNLGTLAMDAEQHEIARQYFNNSIKIQSENPESYNNLGEVLIQLRKLDEAEAILKRAIGLKDDHALAYCNLGKTFYAKGNLDFAIENLKQASRFNPESAQFKLILTVLLNEKARTKGHNLISSAQGESLGFSDIVLNRAVESELVSTLCEMQGRELDLSPDARFGNGRCSPDYKLFETDHPVIKTVAADLIRIVKRAVNADIFVSESFFNIYGAGAGIAAHDHLSRLDKEEILSLAKRKYSLVYYLDVGDQTCSEPGILCLYEPYKEFLPSPGEIIIFSAGRSHTAVYGGDKNRVMIGVNFYCVS